MAFGKKSGQQGWMSGKDAEKLAQQRGRLGDDKKVRDTKGKVIGNFAGRTEKTGNVHGV